MSIIGKICTAALRGARARLKIQTVILIAAVSIVPPGAVDLAVAQPPGQAAPKSLAPSVATTVRPTQSQLATWREAIVKVQRPKAGACFKAAYPDTTWHEVPCKPSTHKLYPPRRAGPTPVEIVGGRQGSEFIAGVSGHSLSAEGSFGQATRVLGECDVPCDENTDTCPTNLKCDSPGAVANSYSLQLNTQTFSGTSACNGAPAAGAWGECKGFQQFVYDPDPYGGGNIQYWMDPYGPPGTECPSGWGSFIYSPTPTDPHPNVLCFYMVQDQMNGNPAPPVSPANLPSIAIVGAAAGVNGDSLDELTIFVSNEAFSSSGRNLFPDLSREWQQTEFNIFGAGNDSRAIFGAGSSVAVQLEVENGTIRAPSCTLGSSFTGESNNLVLYGTAKSEDTPTPILTFLERFPGPRKPSASCPAAQPSGAQCQDAMEAIAATQKQIVNEQNALRTTQCQGQGRFLCTQALKRLTQGLQADEAAERNSCPNH